MRATAELEEIIGIRFGNRKLLTQAMTHTSYENEHKREVSGNNERLEFLGDAVLELVSSEYLFHKYPGQKEGKLSKMRASMVCEPSLAKCARDLHLDEFLLLGKGEEHIGGRSKDSIVSDAMEALIGAVYLDRGFEEACGFVQRFILSALHREDLFIDQKTGLQELLQEEGRHVEYVLTGEEGPDHDKRFTVAAVVDGETLGTGSGRTKKAAAQAAAEAALRTYRRT